MPRAHIPKTHHMRLQVRVQNNAQTTSATPCNRKGYLCSGSAASHGKPAVKLLARSAACEWARLLRCQPEASCSRAPLRTPPTPRQPSALPQPTIATLADSFNLTRQRKPLHALDQHFQCLPSVFVPFCPSKPGKGLQNISSLLCCMRGNCRHTRLYDNTLTSPMSCYAA